MVKRIPAYDIKNEAEVMLVLKRDVIEVRIVKLLHTKLTYTIDPHRLTYGMARRADYGRKSFATMRSNPYPWILQLKKGRAPSHIFRIDSEKDIEVFKNYIRELRTVS